MAAQVVRALLFMNVQMANFTQNSWVPTQRPCLQALPEPDLNGDTWAQFSNLLSCRTASSFRRP